MCGSLLSKFKKTSNKVNPVISTDSLEPKLEPKRVKRRTNLVDHTLSVEESMFRGEITLADEAFTRVRGPNSSEDRCFEVKPFETTKETADKSQSRSLSLCLLAVGFQGKQTACQPAAGLEQKKNESEFGSTVECDSTVDIADRGFTDECESLASSVKKTDSVSGSEDEDDSAAVIEEKKQFFSVVSLGENKIEPDSRSAIKCDSAAGIEEKKIEPDSRSSIECDSTADIEEGKIGAYSACAVESISEAGLEAKKIEPDSVLPIECDSPAGNKEKKIGQDFASATQCDSATGIEEKKIGPVFASAIECDSASGIEEGKVGADCVSAVKSVSEAGLEEKKIESDSFPPIECDSAADIQEKKTESFSESAVPSVAEFGLEEKKLELDYASLIESNATVGLTEKKAESDCRSVPEYKSNAGLDGQKSESVSGSAVESVSSAGFEEKKTEPDSSSDSVASLEKKETASDFRPASDCESNACLDEKNSETYSKSGRKCQSAAGIAQQKTEPDSRSAVECHLAGGLEEKKTGPVCEYVTVCESTGVTGLVCRSVTAACESAAVLEEKKIEVDCGLTAERKSATCLVEKKAGSLHKYVAEWKSAAGLEEKKTEPEFKYGAKCQSAVVLTQKKAELESASSFEQKNTESESKPEAEIVEKTKSFLRSAAICESNADVKVIESAFKVIADQQPNDSDFPPADEHVRVEKDLLGKREETMSKAQDDTHSSSGISGGCVPAAKRPVETCKIPTANQAAVVDVQSGTYCGSLLKQLTESKLQTMSQQTSIMTEEYEKKLIADKGSPDWNSTASRQTLLVETKTEHQVKTTTNREVPLSRSKSQCSVDPMVVSGNQEMLLALASKELEEKIMNVRTAVVI